MLFVDDDDARGDSSAIEEVGGEADDAFDVALLDELAADGALGVAPEEDTVGEDAGSFAGALEGADDVEEVGVVALLGWECAEALEAVVGIVF